ncbi:hypothetical protein KDL29_13450 [bacterium]|nr:hypothetical protein [bacterium]
MQPEPDGALIEQLNDMLVRELSAAGKDSSATQTQPPSGEGNGIRFFEYGLTKATGPDYEDPWDRQLFIYEMLLGDYDANGIVNAADLVPVARYWGSSVDYSENFDATHQYRPMPELWSIAAGRVDGNFDGVVNASDITVIAQHWMESLDGFKIYTSRDAAPEQYQPDPHEPSSSLSVRRPHAGIDDSLNPYEDQVGFFYYPFSGPPGHGICFYQLALDVVHDWEIRVVPVNLANDPQEAQSRSISIPANQPPLPDISINLSGDTAPLMLNVDLSASTDEMPQNLDYRLQIVDETGRTLLDRKTNFVSEKQQNQILPDAGVYTVELEMTDYFGAVVKMEETVEVTESDVVHDAGWTLSRTGIVMEKLYVKQGQVDLELIDGQPAIVRSYQPDSSTSQVLYHRAVDAIGQSWDAGRLVVDVNELAMGKELWILGLELFERDGKPLVCMQSGAGLSTVLYTADLTAYEGVDSIGSGFVAGTPGVLGITSTVSMVDERLWLPQVDWWKQDIIFQRESQVLPSMFTHVAVLEDQLQFMTGSCSPTLIGNNEELVLLKYNGPNDTIRLMSSADQLVPAWGDVQEFGDAESQYRRVLAASPDGRQLCFVREESVISSFQKPHTLMFETLVINNGSWQYSAAEHHLAALDSDPLLILSDNDQQDSDWRTLAIVDGRPVYFFQGLLGTYYIAAQDEMATQLGPPTLIELGVDLSWNFLEVEEDSGKLAILGQDNATGELLYISQD